MIYCIRLHNNIHTVWYTTIQTRKCWAALRATVRLGKIIKNQASASLNHYCGVLVPNFVHKDTRKSFFCSLFMGIECLPQQSMKFP